MPRYFFHTHHGEDVIDHEGTVLAGPDEVRAEAITAAGELLRDKGRKFWDGDEWQMRVTDESGATVCRLTFSAEDCGLASRPRPSAHAARRS